jgi:hypothetical protein
MAHLQRITQPRLFDMAPVLGVVKPGDKAALKQNSPVHYLQFAPFHLSSKPIEGKCREACRAKSHMIEEGAQTWDTSIIYGQAVRYSMQVIL